MAAKTLTITPSVSLCSFIPTLFKDYHGELEGTEYTYGYGRYALRSLSIVYLPSYLSAHAPQRYSEIV